jgi:hypothetical protein
MVNEVKQFMNDSNELVCYSGTRGVSRTGTKLYHFGTRILESLHGATEDVRLPVHGAISQCPRFPENRKLCGPKKFETLHPLNLADLANRAFTTMQLSLPT